MTGSLERGVAAPTSAREGRALGSPLRLVVPRHVRPPLIDAAWSEVREEFACVDRAMSGFRRDSELARLNRAGGSLAGVSRRLVTALVAADRAARVTSGRFDARVATDLERLGAPGLRLTFARPTGRVGVVAGDTASPFRPADCGARFMRLDRRRSTIELLAPVDLGGIGKGLALRWASRRAARVLGGAGFVLDAGGDIVLHGSLDGRPWSIGIEDPSGHPEPVAVCALHGPAAIGTSSVRRGRWRAPDGREVHHLIDPRTREPGGQGLVSVTVALGDPAWAEVWSKALFLEGVAGIAESARRQGLAAWWVDVHGRLSMTPAARLLTVWVREEATRAATTR